MATSSLMVVLASGLAIGSLWSGPDVAADRADVGSERAVSVGVSLDQCTVTGTEDGDDLHGTAGADVSCGLGGDDTLMSSPGDDIYIGGDGRDRLNFAYTNVAAGVKADLLMGTATGHGTDSLDGLEDLSGTPFKDTLKGDSQDYPDGNGGFYGNRLSGGGRGDVLGGRGGNDEIHGGAGNDTLIPGPGDDSAYGETGIDTVSFKLSTAPVTVDMAASPSATGQGTDYAYGENVIGSAHNDTITGYREGYGSQAIDANTLWGMAGDDTLYGQAGNDTLNGGSGTDLCDGGPDTDRASTCEQVISVP